MFSKLLKKEENQNDKIEKMNLTEMRSYVNNKIKDLEVTTDGLNLILEYLSRVDGDKSYISSDDMDSKKKKAFDLVLSIMANKKINIQSIELVQEFLKVYDAIITQYDKEHKEIYASRFRDAINNGVAIVEVVSNMTKKMNLLSE